MQEEMERSSVGSPNRACMEGVGRNGLDQRESYIQQKRRKSYRE